MQAVSIFEIFFLLVIVKLYVYIVSYLLILNDSRLNDPLLLFTILVAEDDR